MCLGLWSVHKEMHLGMVVGVRRRLGVTGAVPADVDIIGNR